MKELDEVKLNLKRSKQVLENYFLTAHRSAHNVYRLQNVPSREFIIIHAGNYHKDALGCLIPGKAWRNMAKSHYYVGNSKSALK
ncbi:DUF5675 family protein [Vibrio jasicida]|uniref:DUF5675 family protein n=1 Tax=Vibrio jasicida TaxID=766224 RepID=UPI0039094CC8